jgi:hypothetical protein
MQVDEESQYRDLIKRYHRAGRGGNCPYCGESWPCTVYKEVIQPQVEPASALNLDDPRHDANVIPCDD